MSTCKKCGAPIIFVRTPGGKSIPCDASQITYKAQAKAKGRIVTPNGEVISCVFNAPRNENTGVGYAPHWVTCPSVGNFRDDEMPRKYLCQYGRGIVEAEYIHHAAEKLGCVECERRPTLTSLGHTGDCRGPQLCVGGASNDKA